MSSLTVAKSYATWMTSLSTPPPSLNTGRLSAKSLLPSKGGGCFSSQRNASLSRRRLNMYLRLVISKDHVTMDPMKVHRVMEWLTPMKVKEVQSFLGFVNFYQKFICDFSNITHPLFALTHKTQQWVWGSPEQEAFDALKKAVTSAPILAFPSQSGCFCLKCDASNFTTRAVLSQVQADGTHQPITFMSKGFSDVEHNYQIHDKEMLAIMHALDEWCHFLEGAVEKFKILMAIGTLLTSMMHRSLTAGKHAGPSSSHTSTSPSTTSQDS